MKTRFFLGGAKKTRFRCRCFVCECNLNRQPLFRQRGNLCLDGGNLNFGVGAFSDGVGIVSYEVVEDIVPIALYSVGKG